MSAFKTKPAGELVPGDWMIVRGVPRQVKYASESLTTPGFILIGYVREDGGVVHGKASATTLIEYEERDND
ncbi:hypothetical protein [Glutamicibacter sp. TV12E]|uniref:hypothetical protein n=1 Tax=Glutamicibacter sp. TV12E TaxID=3446362 RepID=UPI00403417E4